MVNEQQKKHQQRYQERMRTDEDYRKRRIKQLVEANKRWRLRNPEHSKKYYQEHREQAKANMKRHQWKLKAEVLTYYGNGKLACLWCGFDDIVALSLDHIDENGAEERRKHNRQGRGFYSLLKSQGFPEGYQTLCMNCQWVKRERFRKSVGGR